MKHAPSMVLARSPLASEVEGGTLVGSAPTEPPVITAGGAAPIVGIAVLWIVGVRAAMRYRGR